MENIEHTAKRLAALYAQSFGGKASGRYRIPSKMVRDMAGQRRLYPEDVQALTRAMFQEGYVLIDMDSFFVVLSANAFVNYRRANADVIAKP
ncbi:hypothetical protein [Celeribacter sp.]|uniref:hypothetical protein n=1 Tax=Celeribacter sp. TaxID=1890673 RepID=UPI003A8FE27B